MLIEPKVRGFICTTAHPIGCQQQVIHQIEYVKTKPKNALAKKVLVIGASMGFGLASRIACAYGMEAATIGVIFDKPAAGKRTATAGWYNTAAFEQCAKKDGLYATSINGDAFRSEVKQQTIARIKQDLGKVDMVVYSLASPRRALTDGTLHTSVLKTIGAPYHNKTIDLAKQCVYDITVPSATEQEIASTVKVMGGEDWFDWMLALKQANAVTGDAITIAYSYLGPELTHPMYLHGSIGQAKEHLYETSVRLTKELGFRASISVNKALVTQSSAAIPIVPLYITVLYKVMKQNNTHEGCIEQMARLFLDKLSQHPLPTDEALRIRLDDLEMQPAVQQEVAKVWAQIDSNNVSTLADIDGYWEDFHKIFGFNVKGVDYTQQLTQQQIELSIPSIPH